MLVFVILLSLFSFSIGQTCPHQQTFTDKWSVWAANFAQGATIDIPADKRILYDVDNSPVYRGINVYGTLVFDERDAAINSQYILIKRGGTFQIGSPCCPFKHKAIITLYTPTNRLEMLDTVGTKVLGNVGGTLELHGDVKTTSWTYLAQTANKGSRTIIMDMPVTWSVGDHIVIPSTDFDLNQAEEHIIASVNDSTITLQNPLAYSHFSEIIQPYGVDERCAVGLLTRNIVVKGDDQTENFGAHIMTIVPFVSSRFTGVEITRAGQAGVLGRYPMHFHLVGDVSGRAFVKDCSIHHLFSRCLTIHGTDGLQVLRNVAYETFGHCFFLEDGIEQNNTLAYNLGINTRLRQDNDKFQLIPSDDSAAVYWVTNPNNIIIHNIAAGSENFGYWLAFPVNPTGPSYNPNIFPRATILGRFSYNKAHSIDADGLMLDKGPNNDTLQTSVQNSWTPETPNGTPVEAFLETFTAYKCRNRGAWIRGDLLRLRNSFFADNAIGLTFAAYDLTRLVVDTVFVGETKNKGNPQPNDITGLDGRSLPKDAGTSDSQAAFPIRGYEFYDGPVSIRNCKFWGFVPNSLRNASAISMLRQDPFPIAVTNDASQIRIMDNSQPLFFPDFYSDGDKNAVFVDKDGSLTGRPPVGIQGAVITNNNPFYLTQSCIQRSDWQANICPNRIGSLQIRNDGVNLPNPDNTLYLATIYRDDNPTNPQRLCGGSCNRNAGDLRKNFATSVVLGANYTVHFRTTSPTQMQLVLNFVDKYYDKPNGILNYVNVGTCYPPGATITSIRYAGVLGPAQATSLTDFFTRPYNDTTLGNGLWYYDTAAGFLWIRVVQTTERTPGTLRDQGPGTIVTVTATLGSQKFGSCTPRSLPPMVDVGLPPAANPPNPPAFGTPNPPTPRDFDGACSDTVPTFNYPTMPPTSAPIDGSGNGVSESAAKFIAPFFALFAFVMALL